MPQTNPVTITLGVATPDFSPADTVTTVLVIGLPRAEPCCGGVIGIRRGLTPGRLTDQGLAVGCERDITGKAWPPRLMPSALGIITGRPPPKTGAAELQVPRSLPIFAMHHLSLLPTAS